MSPERSIRISDVRIVVLSSYCKSFPGLNRWVDSGRHGRGGLFPFAETGDAVVNRGDEEMKFRVRLGKCDKCIDIRRDGIHATLHGWNCIAMILQPFSLSSDGAELVVSKTSGTTGMHACQVAAENEFLIVAQFRYHFRCEQSPQGGIRR